MAKNQPFFDFFRFSQKLSKPFERNFLQLFYTILESYMCNGIKIVWLGCEKHSQIKPKNGQKTAIFRLFSLFSKTVHTIRTKFSTNILHHIRVLYVQWHQNLWLGCEKHSQNWPKNGQKTAIFRLFSLFSKTVHTIRTKISSVIPHRIRVLLYVQLHQNIMAGM